MLRIGMLTSGGDCQALNAAMRGDTVTGNFFILFVSLHVLETYPAGTPSGSIQPESEVIRNMPGGRIELKAQRILLRLFVVYP